MTNTLSPATEAAIAVRDEYKTRLEETRREIATDVLGTPGASITDLFAADLSVAWAVELAGAHGRYLAADDAVTACMRADEMAWCASATARELG